MIASVESVAMFLRMKHEFHDADRLGQAVSKIDNTEAPTIRRTPE